MNADALYAMNLNGVEAGRLPLTGKNPYTNTSWCDARRSELSKLALELNPNAPRLVAHFLRNHRADEAKHGGKYEASVNDAASPVFAFMERKLREHGLASYLALMTLEERIAFSQAISPGAGDPHDDPEGLVDELYHVTTPLVVMSALDPSDADLDTAIRDQREFFRQIGVEPPESPWGPYNPDGTPKA